MTAPMWSKTGTILLLSLHFSLPSSDAGKTIRRLPFTGNTGYTLKQAAY
jgi:hypothetical protein